MAGMGFRLARSKGMEGSTGNLHEFPIKQGNSTAIFRGDMVKLNAGFVEVAAVGDTNIAGIFWGCHYVEPSGDVKFSQYWPGTSNCENIRANVAVMPAGATMLAKVGGATVTPASIGAASFGPSADTGDSRTGMSRQTLMAGSELILLKALDENMNDVPMLADGSDWASGATPVWAEVTLTAAAATELTAA